MEEILHQTATFFHFNFIVMILYQIKVSYLN
jgi:hypothetical protein